MPQFHDLFQNGAANAWLFIPSAILLDALHGLEPGHSKTMMAAFIVAIRGTVMQAVLLGVSAAISHTAVVWAVALIGLHYGSQFNAEASEPYFQLASAALIIAIAIWMMWRTWHDLKAVQAHTHHHHDDHHDETRRIDTGHGAVVLSIFENGVPSRFQARFEDRGRAINPPDCQALTVTTTRPDGSSKSFAFVSRGDHLESVEAIPEPHEFKARLDIGHGTNVHSYDLTYTEHEHGDGAPAAEYQDAHERAHARDIDQQFGGRPVTARWVCVDRGLVNRAPRADMGRGPDANRYRRAQPCIRWPC